MKANPETNSPISNQGENQSKKILLYSADNASESFLRREIEPPGANTRMAAGLPQSGIQPMQKLEMAV